MKIVEVCNHSRICRISSPPEGDLLMQLQWLYERFGDNIGKDLIPEALNSIIRKFNAGLKNNTVFEFELIVRAEIKDDEK